jgi:hypothetical protein
LLPEQPIYSYFQEQPMTVEVSGQPRAPRRGDAYAIDEAQETARDETAHGWTALDAAVLGSVVISVVGDLVAARLALGWPTSVALTGIVGTYFLALGLLRPAWRGLLGRLFIVGLMAGVIELFTDAAGERVVHSLSYPPGEPLLWASPFYMPLAWALVLMQLGYLGWRLRGLAGEHLPLWGAVLLTALAGALLVPYDEEMAYHAGWWQYAQAPRLGHTPFYVVLFEGAVAAALPLLYFHLEQRRHSYAVAMGLLLGLWMPCAALIAWLLIGRG